MREFRPQLQGLPVRHTLKVETFNVCLVLKPYTNDWNEQYTLKSPCY